MFERITADNKLEDVEYIPIFTTPFKKMNSVELKRLSEVIKDSMHRGKEILRGED